MSICLRNIFLSIGVLLLPLKAFGDNNTSSIEYDKPGPYKVKTSAFPDMKDSSRKDRPVPIKVHYPDAKGSFPLVVFSHGAFGTYDANIFQAQHLATHGYVVVCVEHINSNKDQLRLLMGKRGERLRLDQILGKMLKDPDAALERPKDINFAIDQAIKWNSDNKELQGKISTKKIGLMGHSYGAYTTLVVCGAKPSADYLSFPEGKEKTGLINGLSDPRVTFGLAMSPQGPGAWFTVESYKTIDRPLVCISGTKDKQIKYIDGEKEIMDAKERLSVFDYLPDGDKYFLWLKNATHSGFSGGPKTRRFMTSKAKDDMQRISKAAMLISCEAFLKGKKEALKNMNDKYLNSLCGKVVTKVELFKK